LGVNSIGGNDWVGSSTGNVVYSETSRDVGYYCPVKKREVVGILRARSFYQKSRKKKGSKALVGVKSRQARLTPTHSLRKGNIKRTAAMPLFFSGKEGKREGVAIGTNQAEEPTRGKKHKVEISKKRKY